MKNRNTPPITRGLMNTRMRDNIRKLPEQPEQELNPLNQLGRMSGASRQYAMRTLKSGGRSLMQKAGRTAMRVNAVNKPVSAMRKIMRTTAAGKSLCFAGKGVKVLGKLGSKGFGAGAEGGSALQRATQHGEQAGTVLVEAAAKSTVKAGANIASYPMRRLMRSIGNKMRKIGAKAIKAVVKTLMKAVKLLFKLIKSAVNLLIAACGPVVALLLLGGIIIIILGSAFGIIWNDENSTVTIKQAVAEVDKTLPEMISEITSSVSHDMLVINYVGGENGRRVNNWPDMLAVYATKTTEYDAETLDVLMFDKERLARLTQVFRGMTLLDYYTRTETHYDEEHEPFSVTILYIDVYAKRRDYAYSAYSFTQGQKSMCEELYNNEEFKKAIGEIDTYGVTARGELAVIGMDLPESAFSSDLCVQIATRLGDPYSQAKRGTGDFVDCSYLIWHTFSQLGFTAFPRTAGAQAEWCYNKNLVVNETTLNPGDLVFWSENYGCSCMDDHDSCTRFMNVHHVGMYVGEGKIIDASSGAGRVVYRDLWKGTGKWSLAFYARIPDAYFSKTTP